MNSNDLNLIIYPYSDIPYIYNLLLNRVESSFNPLNERIAYVSLTKVDGQYKMNVTTDVNQIYHNLKNFMVKAPIQNEGRSFIDYYRSQLLNFKQKLIDNPGISSPVTNVIENNPFINN